jgi:serine/threonine-protein kinase HipA
MKRCGHVFFNEHLAGTIEQNDGEYLFTYDPKYLVGEKPEAVSFTLPLQKETFREKTLFSFFDGLIPEGWLLNIAEKNWKVDSKDRMGLLLTICQDCIGAVKVIDASEKDQV